MEGYYPLPNPSSTDPASAIGGSEMGLKHTFRRLGELRLITIFGWLVRGAVWFGILFAAFQSWARFSYPNKCPLPGGPLRAIIDAPGTFTLFMSLALATIIDPSKFLLARKAIADSETRANFLELGIRKMYGHFKPLKRDNRPAFETLLRAAELEVEMELGIVGKGLIQANLILAASDNKMKVVARSKVGPCPKVHDFDPALMVCKAMSSNSTFVQCDVRKIPGFEAKPYNCVVATPISHGVRAFGAISIDSKEGQTFLDREATIDRVLRPYCALILLTLEKEADYYDCPERNAR